MATTEEAEAAVKKFNGQEVDGGTLKVEFAKPAGSGSGGERRGGGYRSGGGGGRSGSRWEARARHASRRVLDPHESSLALADRQLPRRGRRGVARDLPDDRQRGRAGHEAAPPQGRFWAPRNRSRASNRPPPSC